ncbi:MAG: Hsp33 family molecular chaperone HslO, partial [Sphingopyxis sp.]
MRMSASDETGFDRPLTFTLAAQDARGRIVRLGPVLDTILSAHQYPPAIEKILAEALVLTAL